MGYFQCPRCYGTDSYKQREQQFRNLGDGGIGISNVIQRYCRRCSHVKMGYTKTAIDWYLVAGAFFLFVVIGLLGSFSEDANANSEESKKGVLLLLNFVGIFLAVFFYRVFARLRYPKQKNSSTSLRRGEPQRIMGRQKALGVCLAIIIFFNVLNFAAVKLVDSRIKCIKGNQITYKFGISPQCPVGYKKK